MHTIGDDFRLTGHGTLQMTEIAELVAVRALGLM